MIEVIDRLDLELSRGVKGSEFGRYGDKVRGFTREMTPSGRVLLQIFARGLRNPVSISGKKEDLLQLLLDIQTEINRLDADGKVVL